MLKFVFSKQFVESLAPATTGIYYCGYNDSAGRPIILYVGRAIGDSVTIKSRLLDHLRANDLPNVTSYDYFACNPLVAQITEVREIERLQPPLNKRVG